MANGAPTNIPSLQREVLAGVTTFLTMSYIVVVNPLILKDAGVPVPQVFTATIIATIVGTLMMALFARLPIAVAPGMGLNAYFTYSVVLGRPGLDYRAGFAAVFLAAIIFLLLSLTRLRTMLIEAIPENMKHAISAGIGLFIAFLGLRLTGLVQAQQENLVTLGSLHSPPVILAIIGLIVTIILVVLNVYGALFIGMLVTGLIAFIGGSLRFTQGFVALPTLPQGILVWNPVQAVQVVIQHSLYGAVFSFILVTLFDTTGTVIAVCREAGFLKGNKIPRAEQALLSDSVATLVGSMFGTSPTSAYIESATGVAAGGRTGLTVLVVAILFGLAAFFGPMVAAISQVSAITGPVLIIVGSFMLANVRYINWTQFDESFPAFLVILTMPLTSSIATGIALGFIAYTLLKMVQRKWSMVHPLMYICSVLFAIQLFLLPH